MTPSGITADRLERVATRLSNSCWCRHWLHWNYPLQDPWLMAISCLDGDGSPLELGGMEGRGFTVVHHGGLLVYTIPRVDEKGQPFRSPL